VSVSPPHAFAVWQRNATLYARTWKSNLLPNFFEPVFYLLGIGFGLGTLVGDVGDIPYAAYVAPGLMATTAMNGALMESTFNLFFKLKYAKTFDAILATPLGPSDVAVGEVSWSLTRGLIYAIGFLFVMLLLGLVLSPSGILAIPGALLIGLAAASVGMAATTWMRKWQDFDMVAVLTTPMFLFSGTFFPISVYPDWLRIIVELTPLYRGVHMLRSFTTGVIEPAVVFDIAYLSVMGIVGVAVTSRRLGRLLLK